MYDLVALVLSLGVLAGTTVKYVREHRSNARVVELACKDISRSLADDESRRQFSLSDTGHRVLCCRLSVGGSKAEGRPGTGQKNAGTGKVRNI